MSVEVRRVNAGDAGGAGPFAEPKPSMRGRYLIRSSALKAHALGLLDAVLNLLPKRVPPIPVEPSRILLSNWAQLGDVVTTFGAISALRLRYPKARIGMIVGSWGKPALAEANLVDEIHVIDHWGLSRTDTSPQEKRARYRQTRAAAMPEIKGVDYQVAIDLFPFFPPAHPLFFRMGIPIRIGYTSGGFGSLLTHPVDWQDAERPMADQYRDLLNVLSIERPFSAADLRPRRTHEGLAGLPPEVAAARPYIVIHPGAGTTLRYWGHARWRALIQELGCGAEPWPIVLTGAGSGEVEVAGELASLFPHIINMTGRANWPEFVSILANAALVICPDTATGHVAALFNVPIVSIFTGTNSPAKWGPYGDQVRILVKPVLCSPCNMPGCDVMECFRGVTPNHVAAAARELLTLSEQGTRPAVHG